MLKYQTLERRFFALVIDLLVLIPVVLIDDFVRNSLSENVSLVWKFLFNLIIASYFILMHKFFGQTLGKMVCKVKVINVSESPINFKQAFFRESVTLFAVVLNVIWVIFYYQISIDISPRLFYGIDLLDIPVFFLSLTDIFTSFFNEKRRALHDYIAGTVVINLTEKY